MKFLFVLAQLETAVVRE